jgi:molecular chaperone DnaK
VQFEIDANGILHVLARDTRTGREKVVQMKSAVDVDDTAVTRMVEESVEHAFDDLAARRWVETKLKAEELRSATRKGLASCLSGLEPDYIARVETALQALDAILNMEHPGSGSGSGDVKQLQAACAALDEVTKPLADLLMDKAMEAMLRKRGAIS